MKKIPMMTKSNDERDVSPKVSPEDITTPDTGTTVRNSEDHALVEYDPFRQGRVARPGALGWGLDSIPRTRPS